MATLSFSCPECDKNYDRVKPDMVGHKVRCDCGFIFRLGSKSEKKYGVAAKLKQKRAAKQRKAEMHKNASRAHSSDILGSEISPISTGTANPFGDITITTPTSSEEGDLFGDVHSNLLYPSAEGFVAPDMSSILDEELPAKGTTSSISIPNLLEPLPTQKPTRKTAKKVKRKKQNYGDPEHSRAMSIWTLVQSLLGSPIIFGLGFSFLSRSFIRFHEINQRGGEEFTFQTTVPILIMGILGLMQVALSLTLLTSGVVAVVELVNKKRVTWATQVAAVAASIFVAFFLLTSIVWVVALMTGAPGGEGTADASLAYALLVIAGIIAIPFSVAITGFARNQ